MLWEGLLMCNGYMKDRNTLPDILQNF